MRIDYPRMVGKRESQCPRSPALKRVERAGVCGEDVRGKEEETEAAASFFPHLSTLRPSPLQRPRGNQPGRNDQTKSLNLLTASRNPRKNKQTPTQTQEGERNSTLKWQQEQEVADLCRPCTTAGSIRALFATSVAPFLSTLTAYVAADSVGGPANWQTKQQWKNLLLTQRRQRKACIHGKCHPR